jgi:cell wall-associated NlpC family hydrolase
MSALVKSAAVVGVAALLASGGHAHLGRTHGASRAIAYAREQLGKPYVWAATGPTAFDCSGLTMRAWQHAGVSMPRTSQEQWAHLRHVSSPGRGDLVFFAGSDGSPSAPGHVGLVIGPHKMIEAYASGTTIRVSAFGTAAAAPGDGDPVGYADPGAS